MEAGPKHEPKKEELFDAILAEVERIVLSFPASDPNVRVVDRVGSQLIDEVYHGWNEVEVEEPREIGVSVLSRKVQSRRLMPGFEYTGRPAFEFVLENFVPGHEEATDQFAQFDLPGETGPNGRPTRDEWLLTGDRRIFYSRHEAPPPYEAFRLQGLNDLQSVDNADLERLRYEHLDESSGMYRHLESGTVTDDFAVYLELLIKDWYKELQDEANDDSAAEAVDSCLDLNIEQREVLLAHLKEWAADLEAIFGTAKLTHKVNTSVDTKL